MEVGKRQIRNRKVEEMKRRRKRKLRRGRR
jgi:hypothetical protein